MRSTTARRLEFEIGPFEKRHGRRKRSKLSGQVVEYEKKDAPRFKKINHWDVANLLDGDIEFAWWGIRGHEHTGNDQLEGWAKAS